MKNILVVDDEKNIVELIRYNLKKEGYSVFCAYNGFEALELVNKNKIDLIILDLMMSDIDGYEILKKIRQNLKTKPIPIIIISAKSDEFDKILGLELGADDYITKPFSIRELIIRVKALLRRVSEYSNIVNIIKFDNIIVDLDKRIVRKDDKVINLSLKEFELLKLLLENKGRVVTRNYILETIWGYEFEGDTRTVDVHIRFLRKKLSDDDNSQKYIETVRGIGYRFNEEVIR